MKRFSALIACAGVMVVAQPPGGPPGGGPPAGGAAGGAGTSVTTTATTCPSVTTCATDGSSAYSDLTAMTYNAASGKFSGNVISNLCNAGQVLKGAPTPSCSNWTIPYPDYASPPKAAPRLNAIGVSRKGINIYGPFEAGFTDGQVCTSGTCDAGMDIAACEKTLNAGCTTTPDTTMFMDTCGGHANPYHYHFDPTCEYDKTKTTQHSSLVGFGLDGRGLYGMYEGASGKPTDLDSCNGHFGVVPADTALGIAAGGAAVYHYHTTTEAPYTIGCYGPAATDADCRTIAAADCDGVTTTYSMADTYGGTKTSVKYDLWCPCFDAAGMNVNATATGSSGSTVTTTTVPPTTTAASGSNPSTTTVASSQSSSSSSSSSSSTSTTTTTTTTAAASTTAGNATVTLTSSAVPRSLAVGAGGLLTWIAVAGSMFC
eukprot:GDKH01008967.1.p1 GENE.GDKH01008967.1~~GDKH01008967.1.p1  ORF type:complete len:429 (-),score=53.48 GDKH01008967.1:264-1550(-)